MPNSSIFSCKSVATGESTHVPDRSINAVRFFIELNISISNRLISPLIDHIPSGNRETKGKQRETKRETKGTLGPLKKSCGA
jgi:hypothetical protein